MSTPAPSKLITVSGRLALTCLILLPLSVAGVRFGWLHFSNGLMLFALSCVVALIVLLVLVIASFLERFSHDRSRALKLSLLALPPVLLFGALMGSGGDYPAIHDITTDREDPPVFVQASSERGSDSNTLDIKPDELAMQNESYSDLQTQQTALATDAAFARATEVAQSMQWQIYNSDPAAGLIEAAYTSFWFGFVDDIVIRIRPSGAGSEVDLRSVSRVGKSDLGANANRIRAFQGAFGS